jgi:hypothetical protein
MQEQLAAMFGGVGGGAPGGDGQMPDFQKMMAQMMGMGGEPGQNLLGDLDDPAGLGGAPNPFANPDLLSALGGAGGPPGAGGLPGFLGMPGMGGMGMGGGKTRIDKYFPVVHFASVIVLALFTVIWWEPTLRSARFSGLGGMDKTLARWAGLAGGRGVVRVIKQEVLGGIEILASSESVDLCIADDQPVFWAFATLELILQTTRFMILKVSCVPHSKVQLTSSRPLRPTP